MSRISLLPILFSAVLLAPTPASAAKKQAEAPVETAPTSDDGALLLYGPSANGDRGAAALAAVASRLGKGDLPASRAMPVLDWLGSARFRLDGSATEVPCTTPDPFVKPGAEETEIAAINKQANVSLADLEPEKALAGFATAQGRLSCQTVYIDQDTFWESYFYAGIAAFYTGDSQGSRAHFRQAAAIAPERQWDASYPPEPQSTFLSAVQDVIARPKGTVYGDLRDTNYREVWLDGRPLDLTKAFELQVFAGRHLVQAVDGDGRWSTWLYDVREGATLTFFSALGMEQMVLAGPDGVLKSIASSTLSKKLKETNLNRLFVVTMSDDGKATRVLEFVRRNEVWSRLERSETGEITRTTVSTDEVLTPQERNRRAFLRKPDYRASVAVGFKYLDLFRCGPKEASVVAGVERCDDTGSARKSPYIGGLVGIDINLIAGLNLDIRFGATVTDFKKGGSLLPEVGAGIRYRILTGVVQPYLGFAADFFFGLYRESVDGDDIFTVYVGPQGYGGVEFEFPDGFRLALEGGGGVILTGEGQSWQWPIGHAMLAIGRFLP